MNFLSPGRSPVGLFPGSPRIIVKGELGSVNRSEETSGDPQRVAIC